MGNSPHSFLLPFHLRLVEEGPLARLSFAVKDVIDVAGSVTGCANPDWAATHPPAVAHAVCVELLLQVGATCFGKTNADELAFGLTGENAFYGTPVNPAAPDRVPGGSSSGSAAAVAASEVDFALGTDTAGSIRVPASHCGVWGMRPSHGCISTAGVNPLAPSFDTVGVFARNGEVLRRVMQVLLAEPVSLEPKVRNLWLLQEGFSEADPTVVEAFQPFVERLRYHRALQRFLGPGDLLCFPTTHGPAPIKGSLGLDRTQGDYFPRILSRMALAGIGRLPQISLPAVTVDGAPVGLSLLAGEGRDTFVLAAAEAVAAALA